MAPLIHLPDFLIFDSGLDACKRIFVIAVTAAAILPRMPLDKPWTIGGNLSNPFRKLLLVIFCCHMGRFIFIGTLPHLKPIRKAIWTSLDALETVMLGFLSLLTPYLLRVWLSGRVNVGRRPGQVLQGWIKAIAALSMAGAFFRVTVDRKFWLLTKIAGSLSFFPVTRTMTLYNSVTNVRVVYPGRGSILSQVVMVSEYFALFANLADASSKILGLLGLVTQEQLNSKTSPTIAGIYATSLFTMYTRVLCHSILLNVLDEAHTIGYSSAAASTDNKNVDTEAGSFVGNPPNPVPSREDSRPGPGRRGPVVETVVEESMVVIN